MSRQPIDLIPAEDRTAHPSRTTEDIKSSRFPRTSRRVQRIDGVLHRRQPSLVVVLEDVHDPHNASAVLRSCDAVGVLDVHLVYVHDGQPRKAFNRTISASAAKWIRTHRHDSIATCFSLLREGGFQILAAALRADTRDLYATDLCRPTALVFGNERRGVSDAALEQADGAFAIPMRGMVESLNISVACAVTLYEAQRQRFHAGMYDEAQLDEASIEALRADWIRR